MIYTERLPGIARQPNVSEFDSITNIESLIVTLQSVRLISRL